MKHTVEDLKGQRIWLVGGSEGIGLELVKQLLERGVQLVVSARNAEQNSGLLALQSPHGNLLALLDCDVMQKQSLPNTIDQAWSVFNGLDGWIYNAGSYQAMRLDEWSIDSFEQMNRVNYLGAVYLMNGLLPYFLNAQESCTVSSSVSSTTSPTTKPAVTPQWLWNISLASDFGLPYGGGYSAPKAALQNLAESLRPELAEAGIDLKVVNHGFVKTRLTAKNDFPMLGLMTPTLAAEKIVQALLKRSFESRFPFNLSLVLAVLKRLPKSWALFLTQKMLTAAPSNPTTPPSKVEKDL